MTLISLGSQNKRYKEVAVYNSVINIVLFVIVKHLLGTWLYDVNIFDDIFCRNSNVVTLVAKATVTKPNHSQHLYKET